MIWIYFGYFVILNPFYWIYYGYNMDKFIQKLDFDLVTTQEVLMLIGLIDRYKGKWNAIEKEENRYLIEMRRRSHIEGTGSSVRLDGYSITNSEIQNLLSSGGNTFPKSSGQQNAKGYYEALELIQNQYTRIELSGSYIKKLHQLIFKYNTKDNDKTGGYRPDSSIVSAKKYPEGRQRSVIVTANSDSVSGEMNELLEWTNSQLRTAKVHPLIVIASFIYEFLIIHPFEMGNGVLSRLLTTLCFLKNDYGFILYVSLEKMYEEYKKSYNEVLISGERNREKVNERFDQWLLFFLKGIRDIIEKLEHGYVALKSRGRYLNGRQKEIKDFIAKNQPVKISDITKELPAIRRSTLKKDLQYLRAEQVLTMIGKGKGSIYILQDNH